MEDPLIHYNTKKGQGEPNYERKITIRGNAGNSRHDDEYRHKAQKDAAQKDRAPRRAERTAHQRSQCGDGGGTRGAEAALPEENEYSEVSIVKKEKKRRGVSVVAIQVAVIAVLAAVIVLSNFYIENTGINAFLRYVFSPSASEQTDDRTYNEFMAQLPTKNGEVVLEEGVMTFSAKGSVYSPCDGKVTAVTLKDGKYTIEVEHNKNFKSVISGADYAYVEIGSTVYASIPVGFTRGEEVSLCFYNGENAQITNFNVGDGEVVWAV